MDLQGFYAPIAAVQGERAVRERQPRVEKALEQLAVIRQSKEGIDLIGSFGEQSAKGAGNWKRRGVDQEFAGPAFGYDADQDS